MQALTVDIFIQAFRDRHGWKCEPDTRITNDLTSFALEREGSTRDIDELYTIFCLSHRLTPYPRKETPSDE